MPKLTFTQKKTKVIKYVTECFDQMDPSGYNSQKFREYVEPMNETAFMAYIKRMASGEQPLRIIMPNMKTPMNMENLLAVAKKIGVKLFHRIRMVDPSTGVEYITPEEYPVFLLPIRRAQQTIEKKRSIASSDKMIDALTGQKAGDDVAAALSHPEIQVLNTRGLTNVLRELVQVRGGNVTSYGEYRTLLEDSGMVDLQQLDPTSRTRASMMVDVLFAGMHIESNVVEPEGA